MFYCRNCQETHELRKRTTIIFSVNCDICNRRYTDCYFDSDLTMDEQETNE